MGHFWKIMTLSPSNGQGELLVFMKRMTFGTSWKSGGELFIGYSGGGMEGIQSGFKNSRFGCGSEYMFLKYV